MLSRKQERGFTLIELMVALIIASAAMVGIYRGYVGLVVANETQEDLIALNQGERIALAQMVTDIRLAGYNPQQVVAWGIGITVANANDITFRGDFQDAGSAAGIGTISLQLGGADGDDLQRTFTANSTTAPVTTTLLEDVEVLDFVYLATDGTVLPVPVALASLSNIHSVQIALVARATTEDPTYNHVETYTNINGVALVPLTGPAAYPANDMFHRRLMTMEIECRNNN